LALRNSKVKINRAKIWLTKLKAPLLLAISLRAALAGAIKQQANMQFSDTTNDDGIVQDIDFWAGTDSTSFPIKDKTRSANRALDKILALILQADGRWEYDDSNQTDLPIATANLVSGQRDYSISGATYLKITKVLVKDAAGNWDVLDPVDEHDQVARNIIEDRITGTPKRYIKKANSIFLGPEPSYSYTAGLKIHFQRNVVYFDTADTTEVPGFAAPFHRLISLYAAKDYCAANDFGARLANINNEIKELEAGLVAFYTSRNRDERIRMRSHREDYGASGLAIGGSNQPSVDWE